MGARVPSLVDVGLAPLVRAPSSGGDPWDGQVTADVEVVAQEFPVPWALAPLPGERFLVTIRDSAELAVVHPSGDHVRFLDRQTLLKLRPSLSLPTRCCKIWEPPSSADRRRPAG